MLASSPLSSMLQPSLNSFGLARLVCALAVIVSHAMVLASGDRTADPFLALTGFKIADHAVNIFFVLSGVVTAQSFDRGRQLSTFLVSRALRIVPAVVAFALVFGFLIAPFIAAMPAGHGITARETWIFVLRTITFAPGNTSLPGVFAGNPLANITNESLWTVKYEIVCYLGLGIGAALLSRFGRAALVAGTGAVIAAYVVTIPLQLADGTMAHLRHFSFCYALGLAAYLGADRLPISLTGVLAASTALVWSIGSPLQPMATIIFTGYVAIWASSFACGGVRAWCNRTDLSYGLYVWGWPIGQILLDGVPGMSWPLLAMSNIVFAVPFALLSWHLVERPALALKSKPAQQAHRGTTHGANRQDLRDDTGDDQAYQPVARPRPMARQYRRPLASGW